MSAKSNRIDTFHLAEPFWRLRPNVLVICLLGCSLAGLALSSGENLIGFYAAAASGLAVVLALVFHARPFLPILTLIYLTPITLPVIGSITGSTYVNVRLYQPIVILSFVVLVFGRLRTVWSDMSLPSRRLCILFFFYLLANAASVVNATEPAHTLRALVKITITQFPLFLVFAILINSPYRGTRAVVALGYAGACQMAIGAMQIVLLKYFDIYLHPHALFGETRPSGTFTEYAWYGIYLSVVLTALLPWMFSHAFSFRSRCCLFACFIACVIGIVISGNRSSWVATAAALFGFIALNLRFNAGLAVRVAYVFVWSLLAGIIIAISLFPEWVSISARRLDFGGPSSEIRLMESEMAFTSFLQNPLLGAGVGNWGTMLAQNGPSYIRSWGIQTGGQYYRDDLIGGGGFNLLLNTLFESGLFGITTLLLLLVAFGHHVWGSLTQNPIGPWQRAAGQCSVLLFICYLVNSQLNCFYLVDIAWMILGLSFALSQIVLRNNANSLYSGHSKDQWRQSRTSSVC